MMKTKKIKNLKPIELNIHIKYKCPECDVEHWLSFEEAKTKEYVIVCCCKAKLKVKPIKSIGIVYSKSKSCKPNPQKQSQTIPIALLESCAKILAGYGYSSKEAKTLIEESYSRNPTDNALVIIKNILTTIGGIHG
jgi:hypothetical protein